MRRAFRYGCVCVLLVACAPHDGAQPVMVVPPASAQPETPDPGRPPPDAPVRFADDFVEPTPTTPAIEPTHPVRDPGMAGRARNPRSWAPIMGGTLWVEPRGTVAVVTQPARDAVLFVDLIERRVRADHVLAGAQPWRILRVGDAIWVSLRQGGGVARFRLSDHRLMSRHRTCRAPRGLAYDHRADLIRVACAGGELVSLDPATGAQVERHFIAPDLRDVLTVHEHLFVTTFRQPQVLRVVEGAVVDRFAPPDRHDDRGALRARPTVAWRTIAGPDNAIVMIHQRATTDLLPTLEGRTYAPRVIHRGTGCAGRIIESTLTTFRVDGSVRSSVELVAAPVPVDVAVHSNGDVMVASGHTANNALGHAEASRLGIFRPDPDGSFPPCPTPTGSDRSLGTALSAVAFDDFGTRYGLTASDGIRRISADGAGWIDLPDTRVDPGRDVFHTLTPAGISCASCHPEAGDDAFVWRFQRHGWRRTMHLRGGLAGTEPFHWDGEFETMSALLVTIFQHRMNATRHAQSEAVLRWLDGLPSLRASPRDVPARVARGAALFDDPAVGCSTCHALDGAPAHNESVDVGTGEALQVPTLKGIALRPPYMHDGCAETLEARFDVDCGGALHGNTSHLDAAEMSDLIAFLRSL